MRIQGDFMILLTSNAQNIFWLGRYLARVQYACSQFPFNDDDRAVEYAHAFYLPVFDAASLNVLLQDETQEASFQQQFQCAKNNIHDLRGVLSASSFAELNQLIGEAERNRTYICDIAGDCREVLDSEENHEVFLFFSLGQKIEQLDHHLRLKQHIEVVIAELELLIILLQALGFEHLEPYWKQLQQKIDVQNFYLLSEQIHNIFTLDRL